MNDRTTTQTQVAVEENAMDKEMRRQLDGLRQVQSHTYKVLGQITQEWVDAHKALDRFEGDKNTREYELLVRNDRFGEYKSEKLQLLCDHLEAAELAMEDIIGGGIV